MDRFDLIGFLGYHSSLSNPGFTAETPGSRREIFLLLQSGAGDLPTRSPALRDEGRLEQKLRPSGTHPSIPNSQSPKDLDRSTTTGILCVLGGSAVKIPFGQV